MIATALPYRTATLAALELSPWHYTRADGLVVRLERAIAGWDYDFDLALSRKFRLDAAQVRRECGLTDDAVLQVCTIASSQAARYRTCVWRSSTVSGATADGSIGFLIPGTGLAESLSLATVVVLVSVRRSDSPFVAHLRGSRLLAEEVDIRLEGTGSRFPVESVDFQTNLPHLRAPNALWYLSWSRSDLTVPAMRDLRLYLNSRSKALVGAAAAGDPNLVGMLSVDVARQLLNGALDCDEFDPDPAAFPEESTGRVAQRLLAVCFPSMGLSEIRAMRVASPSKFEAMVQSGAGTSDAQQ